MEGARGGRQRPLEVERDFACSRLEEQVLIRVYELAVPVIRRRTGNERSPDVGQHRVELDHPSEQIAKGA